MTADVNQSASSAEAGAAPGGAARGGVTPAPGGRRGTGMAAAVALAVLAGVAFAAVFAFALAGRRPAAVQLPRPSGIPSDVSTPLAELMQLSTVPVRPAPGFTLTDQAGHPVSLASFRGKAVVLTFMDPHCTDLCPIVSREFVDAKRDLGAAAARVAFVAVNVNPYHVKVSDVAAFSRAEGLDSIGSWYFLTGPVRELRRIWSDYLIQVLARGPNADVIHTSLIYFIDPRGRERYVIVPMDDHTKSGTAFLPANQLATWARGIALMARAVGR